jgi:hypothetical protein
MANNEILPMDAEKVQRISRDPQEREKQMMALAMDLSARRLQDGTASAAEIVYWLKAASPAAIIERRNLELQGIVLEAKANEILSRSKDDVDSAEVMKALKSYRTDPDPEDWEDSDPEDDFPTYDY